MKTSILLALLAIPFLAYSQYDNCDDAFENLTCGLNFSVEGEIAEFETSVVGFIATDTEVYVELEWACEDNAEIGHVLDVYSILYEECGGSILEYSPGCDFGPTGESGYTYTGLVIGEEYYIAFASCEGFFCAFTGYLEMENSGDIEVDNLDFADPEFEDGCSEPLLENNEFCINKEIRISTTEVQFFDYQNWTVTEVGESDFADVIWRDNSGLDGTDGSIELFDTDTEIYLTFDQPGQYDICLVIVEGNCMVYEGPCITVEITEPFRYFEGYPCAEDLMEGWTPPTNNQGQDWLSAPLSLSDLTNEIGYIEREVYTEECECYVVEALEFSIEYPGEGSCPGQSSSSCPNWGYALFIDGNLLANPTDQHIIYSEFTEVSIQLADDVYPHYSEIEWYRSPDSSFVPGVEGEKIGSSIIEPKNVIDGVESIDLLAVLYDGYDQYVEEDSVWVEKEMLILNSGYGFHLGDLILEVEDNCDSSCPSNCLEGNPGEVCGWNGDVAQYFENCPNVIGVGNGDFIPANAVVIVYFGPEEPNVNWDLELLCGQTSCVYVTRSECRRCLDAFPNNGGEQSFILRTPHGEKEFVYNTVGNFGNGSYNTKENWTQSVEDDEIPLVLLPNKDVNSIVNPAILDIGCDPNDNNPNGQEFFVKGVIAGAENSNTCCNRYSPTLSFVRLGCDADASTLTWGPNSIDFLPTDILITTDECPYSFQPGTFEDPATGQIWRTQDISAVTNCSFSTAISISINNALSAYDEGIHTVRYKVADDCGNMLFHSFTITIECNTDPITDPELFTNNPWLLDIVDPNDCDGTTIETYVTGSSTYYYINDGTTGVLYSQNGTKYCQDFPGFSCLDFYTTGQAVSSWSCDDTGGGTGGGPTPVDEYPWMADYIDFDDCLGVVIEFYDFFGFVYSYFEANGKWTLFSDTGQVWCTDNPPAFYCPDVYNLGTPISIWECGQDCICTTDYDPVCGDDGVTYSNSCVAECAGAAILYAGDCQVTTPTLFIDYPWLSDVVDPNDCSDFTTVTLLKLAGYRYLFYETSDSGTLYNSRGQLYCTDFPNFSCLDAYGFTSADVLDVWTCTSFSPDDIDTRERENAFNEKNDLSLVCYPNPSDGQLKISIKGNFEQGTIRLLSVSGQTLSLEKISDNKDHELNLQSYESGIYFIELATKESRVIEKIILL